MSHKVLILHLFIYLLNFISRPISSFFFSKFVYLFITLFIWFVAIERCKQQLSGAATTTECLHGQSECSEQTSSEGHVFEEFIPLKRMSSDNEDDEDEEQQSPKRKTSINNNNMADNKTKADWLRSVQLWNNPTPDPAPQKEV